MTPFKFQTYNKPNHPDDDILTSVGEAYRLRKVAQIRGHEAHVERSGEPEHRVWLQHPTEKTWFTYLTRADAAKLAEGITLEPYWCAK